MLGAKITRLAGTHEAPELQTASFHAKTREWQGVCCQSCCLLGSGQGSVLKAQVQKTHLNRNPRFFLPSHSHTVCALSACDSEELPPIVGPAGPACRPGRAGQQAGPLRRSREVMRRSSAVTRRSRKVTRRSREVTRRSRKVARRSREGKRRSRAFTLSTHAGANVLHSSRDKNLIGR